MERDSERRRCEWHAERHRRIEDVDRGLRRGLPVVVREVRRRQLRVRRHFRVRAAREDRILINSGRRARRGSIEAGNRHAGDIHGRRAAVHGGERQRHRLSADDEPIVGHRVERQAVCREERVLVVALLVLQAEVDLVAGRVAQAHRGELASERAQRREARLNRHGRAGVIAAVECHLRLHGLVHDRREARLQRIGRCRAGVLRDSGERQVDVVEDRRLVLLHLAGDRRVDQLILTAAAEAASAAEARQRRQTRGALTLVITVRVGADLGVGPAEQFVIDGGIDSRDFDARRRFRRRCISPTRPASSSTPTCPNHAEAGGEVQLARLPRAQALAQLLGIHRRIAGDFVRFADEHRRRFVRAIAAASLDVHRHEHVGTQRADEPDVVADDGLAAPLVDHFFGIERVAVVDRAREILLRPVDAMRRHELGRAEHADVAKQLGTDLDLPAFAAVVLHVDGSKAHAVREQREQRVGLIVGMRRRLHEGAGHVELSDRQAERDVPVLRRHDRIGHAVLRIEANIPRGAGRPRREGERDSGRSGSDHLSHGVGS